MAPHDHSNGDGTSQDLTPPRSHCAALNAFHAYASDPHRCIETNHYCGHLGDSVRQCLLYDRPGAGARLIGIEYMITPPLYEKLDEAERRLWHSHVYEVKSGMLILPKPPAVSQQEWEAAETKEMEAVIQLYGKVYHLWQTDRGDELPLGEPQLMTSYTAPNQFEFDKMVGDRDKRFGESASHKAEIRKGIAEPTIHADSDWTWKKSK